MARRRPSTGGSTGSSVEFSRDVNKVLITEEDLLLGKGPASQERQGEQVSVNKITLAKIVNTVEELDELNPTKFPVALLINEKRYKLYSYVDNAYKPVSTTNNVRTQLLTESELNVNDADVIVAGSSTALVLNSLTNGVPGQRVTLISSDGNLTVEHSSDIKLKAQEATTINLWGSMTLLFTGDKWVEV